MSQTAPRNPKGDNKNEQKQKPKPWNPRGGKDGKGK